MPQPRCWLFKTEPASYSIDDLERDRRTTWDGVRNYQARNFMRDDMRVGDWVLFYHSGADTPGGPGVAGVAKISGAARPDKTAWDPNDDHHDPAATADAPIWCAVEIAFVEKYPSPVTLDALRAEPGLADLLVLKRGQRLSIQPVEREHFDRVRKMGKGGARRGGARIRP